VPALLSGMTSEEMRFRTLEAEFILRDGQAHTSNLHFDGDAEILMRGRTGLLAHDYDYEAWVLRGEERIPSSLRRLAATPRVAAAWMALRDLIGGADGGFRRPGYSVAVDPGLAFTAGPNEITVSAPIRVAVDRQASVLDRSTGRHGGGDFASSLIFIGYSVRY